MIHCYQFDGLNIVLDCHSGSIHMVDPVAYDMIRWYETEPAEDVISKAVSEHGITREEAEECLADIDSLKEAGKLYAPDKFEGLARDFRKRNFTVAVSSEGSAPAFPPYVASKIDGFLGPEYEDMLDLLTELRKGLKERISRQPDRARFLAEVLADEAVWNLLRNGDGAGAK